jgi:hypothetical protein
LIQARVGEPVCEGQWFRDYWWFTRFALACALVLLLPPSMRNVLHRPIFVSGSG